MVFMGTKDLTEYSAPQCCYGLDNKLKKVWTKVTIIRAV